MTKKEFTTEEIDQYLSGELSPELVSELEKRILEEEKVRNEVTLTKDVIEALEGDAFKKMLKAIHARHFGDKK